MSAQRRAKSVRRKNRQLRADLRRAKLGLERAKNPDHRSAGRAQLSVARAEGTGLVLAATTGKYARKWPIVLRVPDEELVGGLDNPADFGGVLAKIGMLALSAVVNHAPTGEIGDLLRAVLAWARIDVEALRKEAEEDEGLEVSGAVDGPAGGDSGPGPDSGPADGTAEEATSPEQGSVNE